MALQGGIDVDVLTGMPKVHIDKLRADKLRAEHEDVVTLSNIFRAELRELPGRTLIALVLGKLIDNLHNFAETDTECKAYLGILDALNFKVNVMPSIAEQIMNKHLSFTQ